MFAYGGENVLTLSFVVGILLGLEEKNLMILCLSAGFVLLFQERFAATGDF